MSETTSTTSTASGKHRALAMAGWALVGLVGVTVVGVVVTVMFGGVHGVEFCPQTFERRSYSYYELPILRIQVTGERHEDLTGPTEEYVSGQKTWLNAGSGKRDWHVLVGSQGTRMRRPGDAGILMQYLDAQQSDNSRRWVQWSEKNEELAKVLWPAVQQLALSEAYVFVPDLFDLTKSIDCDEELKQAVQKLLAAKIKQAEAPATP